MSWSGRSGESRAMSVAGEPWFKDEFFTFDTEVSMTRETKIGLLLGLGFIVVFAVLLLQTGDRPPSGDLQMMLSRHGNSATSRPETLARLPEPAASQGPATNPAAATAEHVAESLTRAAEPWNRGLPNPSVFNARPDSRDLGPGGSALTETLTSEPGVSPEISTIAPVRVAPTSDAEPSVRPDKPRLSPEPGPAARPPDVESSQTPPSLSGDRVPAVEQAAAPATYVVQKGDNLMRIARKHYNDESTNVVEFLLKSNRDKIRDRHFVLAGQTLVIPVLPANLRTGTVETDATITRGPVLAEDPAPPGDPRGNAGLRPLNAERMVPPMSAVVDAGQAKGDADVVTPVRSARGSDDADKSKDLRSGEGRGSVTSGARDKDGSERNGKPKPPAGQAKTPPGGKSSESAYRWYTVRPKDTLSVIAGRELGGAKNWEEIIKLNKNLNPTKLKAGDRIRLPRNKPTSDSSKRSST
ncbi:MAG: LysM peptidoglycan-binding domain-containing protein [Phycisphaerae bacterium]|nr:LysM peptidoglycan-binding domain-containing protein [Phycisphaerae bacterium]